MNSLRHLLTIALAATLLMLPLQAQNRRRAQEKWEVSFTTGWTESSDEAFPTSSLDGVKNVDVDVNGGATFAFSVTDHVARSVGFELEYALSDHDSAFFGLSSALPALDVKQRLHRISYNAVLYPAGRQGRLRPFALVGAGATYFQTSTDQETLALQNNVDLRSRWEWMYNFGGGVKWFLNQRWALRFDVRNYVVNAPDFGLPRQDQSNGNGQLVPGLRPEGDFRHLYFGAGFTYSLPGRP
ncbi:MAG TPA: outer membrane beta-barrel protein [Acidobacteriota bacterium]|nr:outer membrane beta-barrel protein [Acidobacteriota bacterium]